MDFEALDSLFPSPAHWTVMTNNPGDVAMSPSEQNCPRLLVLSSLVLLLLASRSLAAGKPNVVLIFIDDMGYGDIGPFGNTVNQTTGGYNQTSGASFRILADLSDWDLSLGTNSPGQSGASASPHYRDLFNLWARDAYFPILFSRSKIESAAGSVTRLIPDK